MPVLIFAFLAMAELAFLVSASFAWQRGADVLAESAAIRVTEGPGWEAEWRQMASEERERAGCGEPSVAFPDGTEPGGRVEVLWTCEYGFQLINGMTAPPQTVVSVAVIPMAP